MPEPTTARFPDAARPAIPRIAAAVGPAVFAALTLGCATQLRPGGYAVDLVYAGTGSTRTTGVAAADVGHETIDVRVCAGVRRRVFDDPQTFAAITVGGGCIIPAEVVGRTVIGEPGSMCTVRVDGRLHRLRVTDALVTFREHALWTRFGMLQVADKSVVHARIGGDESDGAGALRHSLFELEAPLARAEDAQDWCVARLAPPPPPPPPALFDTEPVEANAF
ncbi:MAG: hypothetical protein ABSE49_32910 [Polyangiaceae bacterium]|jgi:hypothetical protein